MIGFSFFAVFVRALIRIGESDRSATFSLRGRRPKGKEGERRALEAWEDRTREDRGIYDKFIIVVGND